MRFCGLVWVLSATVVLVCGLEDVRHSTRPLPLPPERGVSESSRLIGSSVIKRANFLDSIISSENATIALPLPPDIIPLEPPSPAPTPLDLSISYSLSSSCLLYLTSLLTSSRFTSCLPFSLLLTTSTTFSHLVSESIAKSNYTDLNALLAYVSSPLPAPDECDAYMASVLPSIGGKASCAADLASKTIGQVAMEAEMGIGNYKLVREAAALTDPNTGVYCYLEAISMNRPDDLYLWSLPASIAYVPPYPFCRLVPINR